MDPNDWTLTGNPNTNPPTQFLGTTDNHPLVIKTNGTEAIRVTTDEKVGIGNVNPQFKLEVTAQDQLGLAVQGPNSGVGAGLQLQSIGPGAPGGPGERRWELLATGATSAQGEGKFNIRDLGDGSDDFTITSGGNVGIGNTDPRAKLDVAGGGHIGVRGISTAANGAGVIGDNPNGAGVFGSSTNGAGVDATGVYGVFATGVYGVFAGGSNFGAYTTNTSVPGGNEAFLSGPVYAGAFFGPVFIEGPLTKPGGGFQIDHPLDPAQKYLSHSFVESPDMKNIYDGVVVLDANGEALIELPAWFETLNTDFRYQLTPIGAPAPNLYIAEEIANNHFKIGGGTPNLKVSWLVTGIRQDAWANVHRLSIESDKPKEEQGYYLHPELYGASEEQHIRRVHYPETAQLMQQRERMKETQDLSS